MVNTAQWPRLLQTSLLPVRITIEKHGHKNRSKPKSKPHEMPAEFIIYRLWLKNRIPPQDYARPSPLTARHPPA